MSFLSCGEIILFILKATPHKARLTALHEICLHIFRHSAQEFLDIRQYAFRISVQSDEKSDFASFAQALCGIASKLFIKILELRFEMCYNFIQ